MKTMKQVLAVLCCLILTLPVMMTASADDGFRTSYTYTYDYWGEVQSSPDAYRVLTVIDSVTLGLYPEYTAEQAEKAAAEAVPVEDEAAAADAVPAEEETSAVDTAVPAAEGEATAADSVPAEDETAAEDTAVPAVEGETAAADAAPDEPAEQTEDAEPEENAAADENAVQESSVTEEQRIRIRNPRSLFVQEVDGVTYLYVCDTGNNRILEIIRNGNQFTLSRVIDKMTGAERQPEVDVSGSVTEDVDSGETASDAEPAETDDSSQDETGTDEEAGPEAMSEDPNMFSQPYDVSVDPEGNIYVADYGNQRIVKMDRDLNWLQSFTKPSDATFDQGLKFLPKKLVVDVAGRVYALCQNVNKGLVKYEANGEFSGFIGANTVSVSMAEYLWKRYFMSKEQRAQSENFVPTEYENIYIDKEGFIYATNTVFDEGDLLGGGAKPIRRLNSMGTDILIKNDKNPPIGDLDWVYGTDNASKDKGPSKFADITVLKNDIYVAIDSTRGRLFGYDSQGILLWAFGTKGNTDGAFNSAVSVEHMGYDLLVLDSLKNSITVFTPTEYGNTIYEASETYLDGEYDRSAELWQDVLRMNSNYPLAFRGIGRAILRQNDYEEAMEYFELAHDRENYGRAFKLYRKEWIEKNILWIVLIIAALLIIPLVRGQIKKLKWEVSEYERGKVRKQQ